MKLNFMNQSKLMVMVVALASSMAASADTQKLVSAKKLQFVALSSQQALQFSQMQMQLSLNCRYSTLNLWGKVVTRSCGEQQQVLEVSENGLVQVPELGKFKVPQGQKLENYSLALALVEKQSNNTVAHVAATTPMQFAAYESSQGIDVGLLKLKSAVVEVRLNGSNILQSDFVKSLGAQLKIYLQEVPEDALDEVRIDGSGGSTYIRQLITLISNFSSLGKKFSEVNSVLAEGRVLAFPLTSQKSLSLRAVFEDMNNSQIYYESKPIGLQLNENALEKVQVIELQ